MDRVLLIRLGALGDVVHAIPVAAALRRAFPAVRIDWLVSARHREILDLVTVVDRRLVVRDRPSVPGDPQGGPAHPRGPNSSGRAGRVDPRKPGGGASLFSVIGELRQGHYDVALDLQGLLKSAVLARSSGAPRVIGFSSRYLREPLARPFYTEVYDPGGNGMYDPNERTHVIHMNLGLLQPLGLSVHSPEFPIARLDSVVASEVGDRTGGRFALMNPGAAWPNKRWPASRFGALAQILFERHRLPSIVLWGPGEEALANEVATASSGSASVAPRTSVADLVALARGAAVMVAGDTGPAHVAAAVGTPLVSIHGPTRPSRNGPWSVDDVTVSRDVVCQCHHLRRCRLETMCLVDIQVDEVANAVERRLAVESTRV